MNRNRINESNVLQPADSKLRKGLLKNIPVFLTLALCILVTDFFLSQPLFSQKSETSAATETTGKYIWITGSPEVKEGLYLLSEKQLGQNFPELLSVAFNNPILPESDSPVTAVQYISGLPRKTNLPPAVANIFFLPVSINRAGKEIISTLPGIGPVLAERIVCKREENGLFRYKEELLEINGIGPKKFAQLVDYIILD